MTSLTDFQKGYISGMIDGEGFLGLVPKGRYMPMVDITTTHEHTVDCLVSMLKEFGAIKVPNATKHKPAFHCRINGAENVFALLYNVTNLLTKKRQMHLLLDMCSMLLGGVPYEKGRTLEIYAELRGLNKR